MFFREKESGPRSYLQIVENRWEKGGSRQHVVATLGRLDQLQESGQLESLLRSGARFAQSVMILGAHERGELTEVSTQQVGPGLIFERLWKETGCQKVIASVLEGRLYEFPVERAIFLTVLHRLFAPGTDRAGEKWRGDYAIAGSEGSAAAPSLPGHGVAWGVVARGGQDGTTPFAPRCTKDLIEERLFGHRRDLFSSSGSCVLRHHVHLLRGGGGETLGQHGNSKDHRPDLKQMVVGVVLSGEGRPVCCELWPGNTTDVKTLVPIVERLQRAVRHRAGSASWRTGG